MLKKQDVLRHVDDSNLHREREDALEHANSILAGNSTLAATSV